MELPYNGRENISTRNHMLPYKTHNTRSELYLFESLPEEAPYIPHRLKAITNSVGYLCLLVIADKNLLLKKPRTYSNEQGEI